MFLRVTVSTLNPVVRESGGRRVMTDAGKKVQSVREGSNHKHDEQEKKQHEKQRNGEKKKNNNNKRNKEEEEEDKSKRTVMDFFFFFSRTEGKKEGKKKGRGVRTDGRGGLDDLTHLHLVEDGGLSGAVETEHDDSLFLALSSKGLEELHQT